jgi:hypothetical protein
VVLAPLGREERILRQHRSKDPSLPLCGLLLGVVRVGFYFFDLVGVAFGVGGGEEDKFIGIPFAAGRAVNRVIAQARCVFDEGFGFGAAFDEVVDRALRGAEAVVGFDFIRSLDFGFAGGNVFDDGCVDGNDVAIWGGGGQHYFFYDYAANVVFGSGNVFHAFSNGPTIRSGFEVPLRRREILGGLEDVFFGGFEVLDGFVSIGLGQLLSADSGTEETQSENEGDLTKRTLHGFFPFLPNSRNV